MSTHNIGFYENLSKIFFQLSSNTHLISSSAFCSDLGDRARSGQRLKTVEDRFLL